MQTCPPPESRHQDCLSFTFCSPKTLVFNLVSLFEQLLSQKTTPERGPFAHPPSVAVASLLRFPCGRQLAERLQQIRRQRGAATAHRAGKVLNILWMDENLHHFEAMGNHLFVGIGRRIIILGLLRWCRISSTHSRWP